MTSTPSDDEAAEAERRIAELRAASLDPEVVAEVAKWPPLSDEKRAELAAILNPPDPA